MITRRGFLQGMLSVCAAPAIVRASSLMPIYVPRPDLTGTLDLSAQDLAIGKIDNFRTTVGACRYSSSFAEPSPQFGAIFLDTEDRLLTFDGTRWVASPTVKL
jgi:hypothetical protein